MWTREEIEGIHQEYKAEEPRHIIRGRDVLRAGDVKVGDRIPYMTKGPSTTTKRVSLVHSSGFTSVDTASWYHGHGEAVDQPGKWPELFFRNEHNAPEPVKGAEWSHVRAQRFLGVPGAKEAEEERFHWTAQMLTHWQGDEGFLKKLDVEFPAINMLGDATRCYGKVAGKRTEGGKQIVEIDVWNINQVGDTVTKGKAEVVLA
jgi:hypothetical protein